MTTYNPHAPQPTLIETLHTLAKGNFVLLESLNTNAGQKTGSYVAVMEKIAAIVNLSRQALDNLDRSDSAPETAANISRALGIILELIPYEEADLLDWFRQSFLIHKERYEIPIENFFLIKPSTLQTN